MEGSLNPQGGGALSHEVTETEVVVAGGGISGESYPESCFRIVF